MQPDFECSEGFLLPTGSNGRCNPIYPPPMIWLLALALYACPLPPEATGFAIEPVRDYRIDDLAIDLEVTAVDTDGKPVSTFCGMATVQGVTRGGQALTEIGPFIGGKVSLTSVVPAGSQVVVSATRADGSLAGSTWQPDLRQLPGFLSILPPLAAVLLAMITRQALLALFAGIWLAAVFVHGYNPFTALLHCFDTYLPGTLVDKGHAAIVVFTVALGGMIGIVSRSGGTHALIDAIAARSSSRRSSLLTTWAAGLVVFFDDYANCLLVGNTVRPFTDKARISREKLAYIVDSTAAPVATIALVSTWIGYQVGLLEDVFGAPQYGLAGKGYDLFLAMLPYSFYSIFTIVFVLLIASSQRDFGPMARAERRALIEGEVLGPDAVPLMDRELTEMKPSNPAAAHWSLAVVPVLSVIAIVVGGLYASGRGALGDAAGAASIREIIASADSYAVLLWAAFGGSLIAMVLALARRAMPLSEAMEAWVGGAKSMMVAVLILVLAWALGTMCKDYLLTGPWLLSQVEPSPHWLPVITFVVSAVIALATGSSFSTMAIVIPIAGPMAWTLAADGSGLDPATIEAIRYATLAAVLSGSVFGDHCSPISDTTIMSSMSSAADHIDHVRTQAPYALVCALAAALIGFIPAGYGISPLYTIPVGLAVLAGMIYGIGRRPDHAPTKKS